MENKVKLWWNHDASIGAAAVGKKEHPRTKYSEEIKPIALVVIELHLSEGISQPDSQSVNRKSVK